MTTTSLVPRWFRGTPATRRPGDLFGALQQEMETLFRDFWRDALLPEASLGAVSGSYVPSLNIRETPEHVEVSAELPGMTSKDIELTIAPSGDLLRIKGEKKLEQKSEGEGFFRSERSYGAFSRDVVLPAHVDDKHCTAVLKDGVLEIKLAKKEPGETKVKRIEVKAA